MTTPEHTERARALLGPGVLLAPEQKIVLEGDAVTARAIGRRTVAIQVLAASTGDALRSYQQLADTLHL